MIYLKEILVNNKGSGYLQTKIKNDRLKKRKLAECLEEENSLEVDTLEVEKEAEEDTSTSKDLNDLHNCTLPEQVDYAKIKLKKTLAFRRNRDKASPVKIKEQYPGFLICPAELVIKN